MPLAKLPRWTQLLRFLVPVLLLGTLVVAFPTAAVAFSDVPPTHPYGTAIAELAARDVIEGYPDGTFRPEQEAWRQHFTKMLVISLSIVPTEADTCLFSDVAIGGPDTLYPDNYIAVAASRGIVNGVGGGWFAPTAKVLRAQAVTMVVRALQAQSPDLLKEPEASFKGTWGDFSSDHAENARLAEANGLLGGLGRNPVHPGGDLRGLDPWSAMPRGELTQLLVNMVTLLEESVPPPPPMDLVGLHDPSTSVTAEYETCMSGACHQLNLVTEHVTERGLGCPNCHSGGASAEVLGAIEAWRATGVKQGCRICHGSAAGEHRQLHELTRPDPTDCTSCHGRNLVDIHGPRETSDLCAECHGAKASARVKQVVVAFAARGDNPRCIDCHTPGTYHADLALAHTSEESGECDSCHLPVLPEEHSRATSSSHDAGCSACHPLPASFDWTGQCADCHRAGGVALALHLAEATVHQTSADSCLGGSCHQEDVRLVHQSTAQGCSTCHSTSGMPTNTDCVTCHGARLHEVREPFKDTCDKCHSIGGPGQTIHDLHVLGENTPCPTCHGPSAPGCVAAACHEHSLEAIHSNGAHRPCTACHVDGPPPGGPGPGRGG